MKEVKTTTIWVVEVYFGIALPKVKRYEAIRHTINGATVLVRGRKQVIRKSEGRRVYANVEEVKNLLRGIIQHKLTTRRSEVDVLERLLKSETPFIVEIVPHGPPAKRDLEQHIKLE